VRRSLLLLVGVLFACGCEAPERTDVGGCEPDQTLLSGTGMARPEGMRAEALDRSGCDAARRAGVPTESVRVVSATAETWPNGSLGCPTPGSGSADVITEGYRLVVQAGDRTYDYRITQNIDGRTHIRLCLS
jgi:hypothetical protein